MAFTYSPQLYFRISRLSFGYAHKSNGLDGSASRSYEYGFLKYRHNLGAVHNFFVEPDVQIAIKSRISKENKDIEDFVGFGAITVGYENTKENLGFDVMYRPGKELDKYAVNLSFYFKFLGVILKSNPYSFIEVFSGYGESIIEYNKKQDFVIRGGIRFFN